MSAGNVQSVAVVGGGILGLATAHRILTVLPDAQVTVLEKESSIAAHQTGHNSGVVHAGLYYPPGSLKATLCIRGRAMLKSFCEEHSVPYREIGKIVVATNTEQLPILKIIETRARTNGVQDLRRVGAQEILELEPHVRGVAALHSPRTAVVDFRMVCGALARQIELSGRGQILLSTPVEHLQALGAGVEVETRELRRRFDLVISCAGLSSDRVAGMVGQRPTLRIVPFRGEYFRLVDDGADLVQGLVYPVPDARYPFLGVHLTRGIDGEVHAGPNAVLALALEGYRWRDVRLDELRHFMFWPGFLRMASMHWRAGLRELDTSVRKRRFLAEARRLLPALESRHLQRGRAGVRAQAVDHRGRLLDDFVLERAGAVTLVRNAPSPAATSSLAIAEHIVAQALRRNP
jgi:L-2-hydroxyglutarate oxidase